MLSRYSKITCLKSFSLKRSFSLAVQYSVNGAATEVLKLVQLGPIGNLSSSEVALKFIAAPINPADINLAEGVYGFKPQLPAIGGNEGVAVVTEVGSDVKGLEVGDWVIPAKAASPLGTWRQQAKVQSKEVIKIANDIPAPYAATLTVNPSTAYRLLRDFESLKPGDVIIQNGANSMVGLAVIQMARELGIKTINVVRSDRPSLTETIRLLTNLGGDINITDKYLETSAFHDILKDLPPVKLALNCVGGEVATSMARVLAPNGTLVTYGGMSKQPIKIPYELLAYKQLKMKGFWVAKWFENHSESEKLEMLHDIIAMIREKKLTFFFKVHDFDDFEYALKSAVEPFQFRKIILNLDYPDRFKEHDERDEKEYDLFSVPVV